MPRRNEPPKLADVLDHYGIEYEDRYGWTPMHCPSPEHEDQHKSAGLNLSEGAFACHGCGAKGDVYNLIMLREGCDYATAVARAEELFGTGHSGVRTGRLSGRPLPPGKGYRPRYRNSLPARLRPFSHPGA